jgi:tagaturonate reductase
MNDPSIQILQFGTGNFLRGFIEPLIEELNLQGESLQVCLVQSTDGNTLEGLRAQGYAYEVYVAGRDQGQAIEEFQSITCIKDGLSLPNDFKKFFSFADSPELKYLISNVTEAGLVWSQEGPKDQIASSFPGRITQWLYTRFEQAPELETILLPCELIPNNGDFLKSLIQMPFYLMSILGMGPRESSLGTAFISQTLKWLLCFLANIPKRATRRIRNLNCPQALPLCQKIS